MTEALCTVYIILSPFRPNSSPSLYSKCSHKQTDKDRCHVKPHVNAGVKAVSDIILVLFIYLFQGDTMYIFLILSLVQALC